MTTSLLTPSLSGPLPTAIKKKRVLLVDSSSTSRDLRADTMRKLGVDVDCAADISEARCWWRADLYNLVLIRVENELGPYQKFCDDVRGATPPQQIAFLVGKPGYLATSPGASAASRVQPDTIPALPQGSDAGLPASGLQRWGILEASQRISAVRSMHVARSMAMRHRPDPPRDMETRYSKRTADWSELITEIEKKQETE
jgi:hypothetical protein